MRCTIVGLAGLIVVIGVRAAAQDPAVIHIGIVDSLVKDLSEGQQKILDTDLQTMVHDFTGLKSRIIQGGDFATAVKKLELGEWHFGVLPGAEFAWAQAKDPKLQPVIMAGYEQKTLHALLMSKKDSPLKDFADLKGKEINLLTRGKVHCRLFAEKGAGGNLKEFFGKVVPVNNSEAALDDILLGTVQAAVVDNTSFELYKRVHPGRAGRLKVVAQSERFPLPVIVHRQGVLSDSLVDTFRKGLFKANQSEKGREVMASFGVSAFEEVPAEYPELVKGIQGVPAADEVKVESADVVFRSQRGTGRFRLRRPEDIYHFLVHAGRDAS